MIYLLALFVGVPIVEIALFVTIGGQIGLVATLAIVIGTAIAGSMLLRAQGLSTIARIQNTLDRGEIPAAELRDGALLIAAAALLLTPGFMTDAIGFALFLPPVREFVGSHLFRLAAMRVRVYPAGPGTREQPPGRGTVIEGSAEEIRDDLPRR